MRYLLFVCCVFFAVIMVVAVTAAENPPASAKVSAKIPAAAKNRKNPVSPSAASLARGQRLFSSQCGSCHGAKGDGSGELAKSLGFAVPDFTDPARKVTRTDGELFYILTQGHGHMPGEGERLDEEWRWDMVNHIRALTARR